MDREACACPPDADVEAEAEAEADAPRRGFACLAAGGFVGALAAGLVAGLAGGLVSYFGSCFELGELGELAACAESMPARAPAQITPTIQSKRAATRFRDRMARRRGRIETDMAVGNLACSRVAPCERAEVRQRLLAARNALSVNARAAANAALTEQLDPIIAQALEQPSIPRSGPIVGVYWSVRAEPDLSVWYAQAWGRGWRLALPRTVANQALEFGLWQRSSHLVNGPWQIPLPDPFTAVEPDLLIVPCLGFDARGWRLGYGGGFYDRTLAARRTPAIGVARAFGQIGELVPEAHDIALDAIVTEQAVFRASTDHDEGAIRRMTS